MPFVISTAIFSYSVNLHCWDWADCAGAPANKFVVGAGGSAGAAA